MRTNSHLEWLIDGEAYFSRLLDAINGAQEEIYIHGWWVSAPELYLKRPASAHAGTRLDRLLQKKAKEGVNVYIVIFKEVSMALPINSYHTKVSFRRLHPNIRIQRHPDHFGGVLYWAHHEKVIVVDQQTAFVGGIDVCFGRYDTNSHALVDYSSVQDHSITIWAGMDYSNPRVRDFRNVDNFAVQLIDRRQVPRMPWHDVHCVMFGQIARDTARHFIQRWNFIKQQKSMGKSTRVPFLLPKPDLTVQELARAKGAGSCRCQLLRSACEWSTGVLPETSIYEAYMHFIENAKHFVFIENQFFISRSAEKQDFPVRNRIASAIIERIMRAHDENAVFRVYVFLPLLPAFESSVEKAQASSVRMIMQGQYAAISRGPLSILGQLVERGIKPENYITFFSLRKHDRLDGNYVTEQVYIHSKLLVVDDQTAILGSANINDRSMLGVRDSELVVLVQDDDQINATMNGQPVKVGRKVQELRKQLMREHLGLLDLDDSDPSVLALNDPVCSEVYFDRVRHQASLNTQLYRELFHSVPDDCVDSWDEYRRFTETRRAQFMDPDLGLDRMASLDSIKGNLVLFPTQFLKREGLSASMMTFEYLLPIEVYT